MAAKKLSPSEFIRSMPTATSAEVMAAAEKAGVKFSRALIYMVRTKRAKAGKQPAEAKTATAAKPATVAASAKPSAASAKPSAASAKPSAPSAKPSAAKPGLSKGGFIRSMSGSSPADVVKAAKAAGIHTNEKYVLWVRWNDGRAAGKGAPAKSAASKPKQAKSAAKPKSATKAKSVANAKAPSATVAAAPKASGQSASDFIRSLPALSPKDLSAAAKRAGFSFTPGYVSQIRFTDRTSAGKKKSKAKAPQAKPVVKPSAAPSPTAVGKSRQGAKSEEESSFLRSAMRLGLNRSIKLLRDLDAALVPFFGSGQGLATIRADATVSARSSLAAGRALVRASQM